MTNPTTPFEDSSGATLTTLAAEGTYISALLAANPTTITNVALPNSAGGRAMYYLKFGTPSSTNRPVMILGSVHGDEVAGRESALVLARWLVETADTDIATLLSQRQVILVPTANPDGKANALRTNQNTQDINRHYIDLLSTAPESVALAGLIHAFRPAAVQDCHEWNAASGTDTYIGNCCFPAVDYDMRAAQVAVGDAVKAALIASSPTPTCTWYSQETPANSVQHLASLVGTVYTLVETSQPGTRTVLVRFGYQTVAQQTFLKHMAANAATYQTLGDLVRARTATRIAKGQTSWLLTHGAQTPVTATGYTLTSGDWTTAQPVLDGHGILYDAPNRTVYLGQPKAQLVTLLLDPSSDLKIVSGATRLT